MKKNIILTSLLAVFIANSAVANIEGTEAAQVKANLTTEFKVEPQKTNYSVKAPDGTDSTLASQTDADYTNYSVATSADGTNVKINNGITLNIAQNTVANTDYQYLSWSKGADGWEQSFVAGDTSVVDLSDTYTSAYITSPLTVSTADNSAPAILMGTGLSDATYRDGSFYLTRDAQGNLQLNGSQQITEDNPTVYQSLVGQYTTDKDALDSMYNTLVGYKTTNGINATAVATAVSADTASIAAIASNRADFTAKTTTYNNNLGAYTAYNGSLAQTIDGSVDNKIAANNENITTQITSLISDKETNMSAQLGYDVTKNPTNTNEANSLTSKLHSSDTDIVSAINTNYDAIEQETDTRELADSTLQANIETEAAIRNEADTELANFIIAEQNNRRQNDELLATAVENTNNGSIERDVELVGAIASEVTARQAGDVDTLANAKTYSDGNLALANNYTDTKIDKLDKDLSGGIAAATALSSVEVSNVKKGEVSVGGGYGYYNGESAGAFGAAMGLTDNWSVNVGAGIHSSNTAFRAGTNYKFKLF